MERKTEYRVRAVLVRTEKLRRERARHLCEALSALCLLLGAGLAGMFSRLVRAMPSGGSSADAFGAMLLHEDAGGYVLVSVLSFSVGVFITILCIWWRKKHSGGGQR